MIFLADVAQAMNFADPRRLWLALAAPVGAWIAFAMLRRRARSEAAWASRAVEPRLRPTERARAPWIPATLAAVAILGTALGLARPRWGESEETVEQKGVDVVFVLDTSASMAAYDVTPSRLWLAQSIVRRMAQAMPGNRMALVQAEGVGVVMSPLTVDAAVLDLLLDAVEPGSLPVPGTQLAPALDRAISLFPEGAEKQRVMVLLSDGEIFGEDLGASLEKLKSAGVVVHTVGVGTAAGAPVPVVGRANEFKHAKDGQVVVSRLDPKPLQRLAEGTGGDYLEATSAVVDPSPIVDRILEMEKRDLASSTFTTLEERFQVPLAVALVALALKLALGAFGRRRSEVMA